MLPITCIVSWWGDEIRPASAVNVSGQIIGDAAIPKRVSEGERIVIDRVDNRNLPGSCPFSAICPFNNFCPFGHGR
ncbi:MAG: hypothetical protein U9Q68_02860 [Euryarchaeota archaeon]|nr:hypothetical protein [Euryarchaeota archaeon]